MAFQIPVPFAVPVPEGPRKTDPRIQCIIDNEFSNLQKLIRGKDINGLYPFEVWTDDVTLLTAAVVCKNEEICSYLLEESADPNICSTKGQTPLHYAALTGVSLSIVKRLLTGKADPNGNELQIFTPLQCAVDRDREDIVKALIEAGASPENNYGRNPELDKKVERMIFQLSSQSKEFEKVHLFFSLFCAVQRKHQTEVYETLEEYIQDHLPDDSAERSLVLKKLVKEILCSLQVLHDQKTKVLHRDIKPQNVLIGRS
uniref:Protein kinase domain-containing protein n=1 Tax=Cyprinus carpio TaxID=7962 RepID=A0A8C2KJ21_CYPCA